MRPNFIGVLLILLGLSASVAAAGADATRASVFTPRAAECGPGSPEQRSALAGDEWQRFRDAVRVCAVHTGGRPARLFVASVWADLWYARQADGAVTEAMPLPLLLGPNGERMGELPANFPSDPPAELQLRFLRWRSGLPGEIRLCLRSPTASGDQALAPLRYRSDLGRYTPEGPAPSASQQDDCRAR